LESFTNTSGVVESGKKETSIFIYPGYEWRFVDSLITNFHLPMSTLLMLVSALSKREFVMNAYDYAIKNEFRFFSFGDAMWIH
jgi:S-adenosylmethionine:tRNA ribosyltransferase-isomerase